MSILYFLNLILIFSFTPATLSSLTNNIAELKYQWQTGFYTGMPVDHFYGLTQDTFNIKFLYNLSYYQTGGPIFFYLGNEGAVEKFAQNTGIMWYLAKTFNAALVFAEHRYYGESLPYGKLTFVDVKYLQFLSVPQVLADCATFIPWFKENVVKCNPHVPVIAFGGSYGGMLAAWFRIAYPNVTAGAWAASAPLLLFHGSGVPIDSVAQIATQTFLSSGCNFNAVVNGFQAILDLSQSNNGRDILYQIFGMSDYLSIRTSIEQAFLWLASIDYPYPTNFLKPLPEWPVELACKSLSIDSSTPEQRARAMYEASSVWNGNKEQNNFQNDENMLPNMYSWKWQTCTEIVLEYCYSGPPKDFFWPTCTANDVLQKHINSCQMLADIGWNSSMVKEDFVKNTYGFSFANATNLIFTDGTLDPWYGGSITQAGLNLSKANARGVYVFDLVGSAHHLELRNPNTCDPPNVVNARDQIATIIKCWSYQKDPSCTGLSFQQSPLPSFQKVNTDCRYIINGCPMNNTFKLMILLLLSVFNLYNSSAL